MSKVFPLAGNQMRAVDPADTVWLSASAGTGKTQVLSARVLRLLLQPGVSPSQLLCLTFTKAGAAEMAVRVNEVLANWVRMPDTQLYREMENIGAPVDPESRDRARTLFASVLDCPGGGLRIDTIHAFSQWLLAGFPEEAGLSPGTRPMEDRDRILLLRGVLGTLLVEAESRGDHAFLTALSTLAVRMKDSGEVEQFLLRCASAHSAWFGPGSWELGDLRPRVLRLLGLPDDADEVTIAALCGDEIFDVESLRACGRILGGWKTKTGQEGADEVAAWLPRSPAARLETLENLVIKLFNKDRSDGPQPRQLANVCKQDPAYADYIARVGESIQRIDDMRGLLAAADYIVPALTLGRAFAHAWDEAKKREGLIDFDDQIRQAAELLGRSDVADWIRYKLDRQFDHVLIDEAQDTNAAQWEIINALTGDFFSGEGQHGEKLRTLFVVGDYKQAIFRFQGTSPENFQRAKERVKGYLDQAVDNIDHLRDRRRLRELQDLGLGQSFRTARPILEFVDRAIDHIGPERFGLRDVPEKHVGEDREGLVTLWQPVGIQSDDDEPADVGDEGEEGWIAKPDRQLAEKIAKQVKAWLHGGGSFPLQKGEHRLAKAGDIMVLVRKRKDLAGLIVARLHAAGVAVAGVDRLRLGAPLAVKDLVAALRFAVQPLDDLNLAALLVSPLVGWSQEQLLEHGYRGEKVRLWAHLRQSRDPAVLAAMEQLLGLLRLADYETPQALLHWLLVGPWRGREKLVARLGSEANDPIDELVNAAHAYAMTDVPSLVGFLHWFDAGDGELKREAEGSGGLVRVMTVHGSKGLQAPIVILADAADNPDRSLGSPLELSDPLEDARRIPLPGLRAEEKRGRLEEEEARVKAEEREEHWRLLYVAMTRAEEALFVTGALASNEKELATDSWYARLAEVMASEPEIEDKLWGSRIEYGALPPMPFGSSDVAETQSLPFAPPWAERAIGEEPRPPRPLAPSAMGEERSSDPPWPPGTGVEAARRGVLIHRLLERLPELASADRAAAASAWLARNAADLAEDLRREMVDAAVRVLGEAAWADLFGPDALAEVPIAALVGDQVVAGTIDRLLVEPGRIRLIDFKTARRPPQDLAGVPQGIVRQMAAYAAALEVAYPGRQIDAAVLYTSVPALIEIPTDLLLRFKPGFSAPE